MTSTIVGTRQEVVKTVIGLVCSGWCFTPSDGPPALYELAALGRRKFI